LKGENQKKLGCHCLQFAGCGYIDAIGKIVSQNKHRVVASVIALAKL